MHEHIKTQTQSLFHHIILNASNMPRPWWDTATAGVMYWGCMFLDFVNKSPAWTAGARFATFCGVCSYSYKIGAWLRKTAKDYKNKGK
jgi:hypothetical protein